MLLQIGEIKFQGDYAKIKQILINLVENGAKYSFAESISLTVNWVNVGSDEDRLEFQVADRGIGIKQELLDVIFEPFRRVDSSLARQIDGVGLGLSISREYALAMGGELLVESEIDKGSTFRLIIPIA